MPSKSNNKYMQSLIGAIAELLKRGARPKELPGRLSELGFKNSQGNPIQMSAIYKVMRVEGLKARKVRPKKQEVTDFSFVSDSDSESLAIASLIMQSGINEQKKIRAISAVFGA